MLVFLSAKPYCLIGTVCIGCADYMNSPPAKSFFGGETAVALSPLAPPEVSVPLGTLEGRQIPTGSCIKIHC